MGAEDGWEIEGLDAYPKLDARKRFPTKKHMLIECPRNGKTIDVIFTRTGRPLCLSLLDEELCDFCWAHNLIYNKDVPEPLRVQILTEASYWQSIKVKYMERE